MHKKVKFLKNKLDLGILSDLTEGICTTKCIVNVTTPKVLLIFVLHVAIWFIFIGEYRWLRRYSIIPITRLQELV